MFTYLAYIFLSFQTLTTKFD